MRVIDMYSEITTPTNSSFVIHNKRYNLITKEGKFYVNHNCSLKSLMTKLSQNIKYNKFIGDEIREEFNLPPKPRIIEISYNVSRQMAKEYFYSYELTGDLTPLAHLNNYCGYKEIYIKDYEISGDFIIGTLVVGEDILNKVKVRRELLCI